MEKNANYLNVAPSSSHLCDMARVRIRAENAAMQDAMRNRDRELAKSPANMARATQHQAEYVLHHKVAALMRQIMEESCGL